MAEQPHEPQYELRTILHKHSRSTDELVPVVAPTRQEDWDALNAASREYRPTGPVTVDSTIYHDPVNKAAHYNTGRFEVIEVLSDWGLDGNAYLWNAVKYIARHAHKANPLQDLKKARYYLDRAIERLEQAGTK
jgi:hypothetical protein